MAIRLPNLPHLGPRMRRVVRIGGYILLALVTFVFALQLTFPYGRVKARFEEALATKYIVTIGDVERGIVPGRVYFNSVSLQSRPSKPDEPVTTIYIDRLEIDLGLLALLAGRASINLDAKIGPGSISGNVSISKGSTSLKIDGKNLQAQTLPMREAIGLPMFGLVEFSFELDLPNEKNKTGKVAPNWANAEGSADLACPSGCTFGDGKTKLKTKLKNTRNQAFAGEGIEFGKVNINTLVAKVEIKNSELKVTSFDAKSDDGQLFVDYEMQLAHEFNESMVTGCLRFTGSQALLKREPKTFTAISATGAPLGPDNLYHIKLTDKFKDMKRLGVVCGAAAGGKGSDGPGSTPRLTVQPDEPVRQPELGSAIAPTFNPPPVPAPDAGTGDAGAMPPPGSDHSGSGGHGPGSGDGHGSAVGSGREGASRDGAAGAGAGPPAQLDTVR